MKKLFPIILLIASAASLAAGSVRLDFDGDGKTDPTLRSALIGPMDWWVLKSTGGVTAVPWGIQVLDSGFSDESAHADYDGDGKTDFGVWRLPNATAQPINEQAYFWIFYSSTGTFAAIPWGRGRGQLFSDKPIKGDFDGDGKDDVAISRIPLTGSDAYREFYILQSRDGIRVERFGISADEPVSGDFDGDGKSDLAVARFIATDGQYDFYIKQSSNGNWIVKRFGTVNSDYIKTGDYDGDGKTDIGVWGGKSQFATGRWSWIRSSDGQVESVRWGFGELFDKAAQGDYDGDGKTDVAIYRRNAGGNCDQPSYFWIRGSTAGTIVHQFGTCHGHPFTND